MEDVGIDRGAVLDKRLTYNPEYNEEEGKGLSGGGGGVD